MAAIAGDLPLNAGGCWTAGSSTPVVFLIKCQLSTKAPGEGLAHAVSTDPPGSPGSLWEPNGSVTIIRTMGITVPQKLHSLQLLPVFSSLDGSACRPTPIRLIHPQLDCWTTRNGYLWLQQLMADGCSNRKLELQQARNNNRGTGIGVIKHATGIIMNNRCT